MSDTTRAILTNRDVIRVDQDWGGQQGALLHSDTVSHTQVWVKPMHDGSRAVVLLNRGTTPTTITVAAADLGLPPSNDYQALDVWAHTTQTILGELQSGVPGHGAAMFIVKKK
jgi:alpha-galactosidase